MSTQRLLAVIVVLQALTLLGVWVGIPSVRTTSAQVPDGGAQRAATIDQLTSVNTKLDKLITLLSDGKLQVRVTPPDENK